VSASSRAQGGGRQDARRRNAVAKWAALEKLTDSATRWPQVVPCRCRRRSSVRWWIEDWAATSFIENASRIGRLRRIRRCVAGRSAMISARCPRHASTTAARTDVQDVVRDRDAAELEMPGVREPAGSAARCRPWVRIVQRVPPGQGQPAACVDRPTCRRNRSLISARRRGTDVPAGSRRCGARHWRTGWPAGLIPAGPVRCLPAAMSLEAPVLHRGSIGPSTHGNPVKAVSCAVGKFLPPFPALYGRSLVRTDPRDRWNESSGNVVILTGTSTVPSEQAARSR
jgi:hypothetical protein